MNKVDSTRGASAPYGHKNHINMTSTAQMVTGLFPTLGNAHDGHDLAEIEGQDLGQDLSVTSCAAEQGYDDTESPGGGSHTGSRTPFG